MTTEKIVQILLGLVAAIAIALASFSLKWVFDANAQLAIMQTRIELKFKNIDKTLLLLADDSDETVRVTRQLQKHWKLHTWAKDQIAEIRYKLQMKPVSWPNLD